MELTVAIHDEGGSYWSQVRELPGCFASGRTLEELGVALEEAVGLYVDDPGMTLVHPSLHVGDVVVSAIAGPRCDPV
jgi:predicted RNase H-like HicB family nuclease